MWTPPWSLVPLRKRQALNPALEGAAERKLEAAAAGGVQGVCSQPVSVLSTVLEVHTTHGPLSLDAFWSITVRKFDLPRGCKCIST